MTVAERFGQNLARLREDAEVTQEDLAYRASLHRTEIGLLERGGRIPRIDTLAKLAGALGVSPAALLEGIVWEPGEVRAGRFE
jgi:transcriptional regulator with XRE-family HTH domain